MKNLIYSFFLLSILTSCNNKPTLQKFFVENSEKKDFIALDVSSSILNIDNKLLSVEQKKALETFDKMNILAFKATDKNKVEYEMEKTKLDTILKNKMYQQLIKVGSGKEGATINFVGTEDNIREFIVCANKKDKGFAVVRILGDKMSPNSVMELLSVMNKSNLNMEQLKPLQELMK